jgi:hypothetical protein
MKTERNIKYLKYFTELEEKKIKLIKIIATNKLIILSSEITELL